MANKVFRLESDVRTAVRKWWPGACFIEFGRGGTEGLPDSFMIGKDGKIEWWAELKLGEIGGEAIGKQVLRYTVRPAQKQMIRRLIHHGHSVIFIVGIRGTNRVKMLDARVDGAIAGVVDLAVWGPAARDRVWE